MRIIVNFECTGIQSKTININIFAVYEKHCNRQPSRPRGTIAVANYSVSPIFIPTE